MTPRDNGAKIMFIGVLVSLGIALGRRRALAVEALNNAVALVGTLVERAVMAVAVVFLVSAETLGGPAVVDEAPSVTVPTAALLLCLVSELEIEAAPTVVPVALGFVEADELGKGWGKG